MRSERKIIALNPSVVFLSHYKTATCGQSFCLSTISHQMVAHFLVIRVRVRFFFTSQCLRGFHEGTKKNEVIGVAIVTVEIGKEKRFRKIMTKTNRKHKTKKENAPLLYSASSHQLIELNCTFMSYFEMIHLFSHLFVIFPLFISAQLIIAHFVLRAFA